MLPSRLMPLLIAGVSTFHTAGPIDGFLRRWIGAWLSSWIVAFPVVLGAAPVARRIVHRLVKA